MTSYLTPLEFRQAVGHFATGVTVITAESEPGKVHGMTANSFTSVSLEPLLILICVDHRALMLPILKHKKRFGVNVLQEGQQEISRFFAKPEQDASEEERLGIRFRWNPSGVPFLEDTILQMACNVVSSQVAGDHTIFIAEAESAEVGDGHPLLYFRGSYRRISPVNG